jgi:hypothetical protein
MLAGRRDRSYQIENQKALTGGKIDWTGCLLSRKAISPKTQAAAKIKAKKTQQNFRSKDNHKTASTAQPGNKIKKRLIFH